MKESWISLGDGRGNDSRFIKYTSVSINKSHEVSYKKPDENDYQKENYRFLGYERIDLAAKYDLTPDYLKAEEEWLKVKNSNAFIPDKLIVLYDYAKEVDKNPNHDLSIRIEADSCNGKTLKVYWNHYKDTYIFNDTEASTLKAAFSGLLEYLKNHQTDYAEFNVDADENWFIKRFEGSLHDRKFSALDKDEQELIKEASQSLDDFFLNKYYFKYVNKRVSKDFEGFSNVRKTVLEECILAKTQEEAEAIYNGTFPRGGKINCSLAKYDIPYDEGYKREIEELELKIKQCKEKLKELKANPVKNFVRAEIGFEGC